MDSNQIILKCWIVNRSKSIPFEIIPKTLFDVLGGNITGEANAQKLQNSSEQEGIRILSSTHSHIC